MKKVFLLLMLCHLCAFSQDMLNSIPIDLKNNRDVFQVVNDSKNETALFLSDRKKVTALKLDNRMLVIDSVSVARPEKKYKDIIGYNGDKSNPVIFWGSSDHKEIYSQFYDFSSHKVSGNTYKIPLEKEEFLLYFSEDNIFYMLTTVLKSSFLNLYVFKNGNFEKRTIDLSELKIVNADSKTEAFSTQLKDGFTSGDHFFSLGFKTAFRLEKIEPESPTSLTESSKKIKCYTSGQSIIITSDENPKFTQFITIPLETGKPELQLFPQKEIVGEGDINSNSFFMDGKLFQMVLNSEKMFLTVKDLDGKLLSEYSANGSEPINFKNSDVVRKSASTGTKRVLEKTSQFLRKINDSKCGISSYKIDGNYLLTIGTVSDESSGGGGGMMPMGGFGVGPTHFTSNFSYVYFNNPTINFDSYANRRVVYLNSLFNENAQHIEGEVPELAFDKMKEFSKRFYEFTILTVYKSAGDYYLGYYNINNKQYVIRQFTE